MENKETKEDFCGACMIVPLAFASIGANQYSNSKNDYKKQKKILLITGFLVLISILVIVYYTCIKKDCNECSFSSQSES